MLNKIIDEEEIARAVQQNLEVELAEFSTDFSYKVGKAILKALQIEKKFRTMSQPSS